MSFQAARPTYRDVVTGYQYNSPSDFSGNDRSSPSSLPRRAADVFEANKWLTPDEKLERKNSVLLGRADSIQAPARLFNHSKQFERGYSRVPHNSPLGFEAEGKLPSGDPMRLSSARRTFPKTGETGKIPTRNPGESLENYLKRVGGVQDQEVSDLSSDLNRTSRGSSVSSRPYQMPQGRLSDDVNAIYQPDGRWIFSEGKQEFERGKIIDGKFVKERPSTPYRDPVNFSSRRSGEKYPEFHKPAARYEMPRSFSEQKATLIGNRPLLLQDSPAVVKKDVEQTLEEKETSQCWRCTGIAIAAVGTVAAVVLAVLMSMNQDPSQINNK